MIKVELSLRIKTKEWAITFTKIVQMPCLPPVGSSIELDGTAADISFATRKVVDIWWCEGNEHMTCMLALISDDDAEPWEQCVADMAKIGWSVEE